MGKIYVIHDPNQGYWNNDIGYVEHEQDASFFTEAEHHVLNLPNTIGNVSDWKETSFTRQELFNKIFKNTHKDSKGIIEGVKSVISLAEYRFKDGAPSLVIADTITDNELCDRLG